METWYLILPSVFGLGVAAGLTPWSFIWSKLKAKLPDLRSVNRQIAELERRLKYISDEHTIIFERLKTTQRQLGEAEFRANMWAMAQKKSEESKEPLIQEIDRLQSIVWLKKQESRNAKRRKK